MRSSRIKLLSSQAWAKTCLVWMILVLVRSPVRAQTAAVKPIILSARVENGAIAYKLGRMLVEDKKDNSILANLARTAKANGTDTPVFVIVDFRAPFSEFSKLATALDKADFIHRRFFVAHFNDGTMVEIHWNQESMTIPGS